VEEGDQILRRQVAAVMPVRAAGSGWVSVAGEPATDWSCRFLRYPVWRAAISDLGGGRSSEDDLFDGHPRCAPGSFGG
jgi:hypothetical protein